MSPELEAILLTAFVGLLALVPVRRVLGVWPWLLFALPTGLLAWSFPPLVTTLTRTPSQWRVTLPVALVSAAVVAWVAHAVSRGADPRGGTRLLAPAAGYLLVLGAVAAFFERQGLAVITLDSWMGYSKWGAFLRMSGRVPSEMVSTRGLLQPAYLAVHRLLGGDLAYVIYPVATSVLAAVVVYAIARTGRARGLGAGWYGAVAVVVAGLMISVPMFRAHAVYLHSNMLSGLFLTAGIVAVVAAMAQDTSPGQARVWLLIGGLMGVALVYERLDGLAYAFVLHALVAVAALGRTIRVKDTLAFFAPYVLGCALLYGLLIHRYGWYATPGRLSAAATVAVIAASAAVPVVVWVLDRLLADDARIRSPRALAFVTVGLAGIGLAAAVLVSPDTFSEMSVTLRGNLFEVGGWGRYWYWALGVLALGAAAVASRSFFEGHADRAVWTAVALFLIIDVSVHGLLHTGRPGWSDSQNRVLIQIAPVLFWLYGELLVAAVSGWVSGARGRRRASDGIEVTA